MPRNLKRVDYLTPMMATFVCVVALAFLEPPFLRSTNLVLLLYYTALVLPSVLGMYTLILTGLFDLSIGSTAALAGVLYALGLSFGYSNVVSLVLGLTSGMLIGGLNWVLISLIRVPALVGTLITMAAVRGIALLVTSGRVIGGLPSDSSPVKVAGIPQELLVIIGSGLLLVVGAEFLSQRHFVLRRLYYLGSNRQAALAQGLSAQRLELLGFICAAVGASAVGIMQSRRTLSASPLSFPDLALDAIAACVIGGMSLNGGRGRAFACAIGLIVIVSARNLVNLAGASVYVEDLAVATILLLAVLFDHLVVAHLERT